MGNVVGKVNYKMSDRLIHNAGRVTSSREIFEALNV
jgi:hypothetical protein